MVLICRAILVSRQKSRCETKRWTMLGFSRCKLQETWDILVFLWALGKFIVGIPITGFYKTCIKRFAQYGCHNQTYVPIVEAKADMSQ